MRNLFLLTFLFGSFSLQAWAQSDHEKEPAQPPAEEVAEPDSVASESNLDLAQDPISLVRQGVEWYRQDRFQDAHQAFEQAATLLPEHPRIQFGQATTALALGEVEQARSGMLQAAAAPDPILAAEARYNLGVLAAQQARNAVGDDLAAVAKENRQEILDALQQAATAFRECIELKEDHGDARYNLELVRRYRKEIEDFWRQLDKQEERDSKDLLEFLSQLQERQEELRNRRWPLAEQTPSLQRDQALRELAYDQDELALEMEALKAKIVESMQQATGPGSGPGGQGQGPDPQQLEQAIQSMQALAESAREAMETAAMELQERRPEDAKAPQGQAAAELERLYQGIAPFHALLRRGIETETVLLALNPSHPEPPEIEAEQHTPERDRWQERQRNVQAWCGLLTLHAEQQLSQLEPLLQSAPPPPPTPPSDQEELSEEEQAQAHMRQLAEAMELALELAPQAEEAAREAVEFLASEQDEDAFNRQQEVLDLLQQIADAMPKDPNSQEQGDQQDSDQEQPQDQEQEQDQEQDSEQDQPPPPQENPESEQDSPPEQQPEESPQQQPPMSREQAQQLLQRAREREQEYKEHQKEKARIQQWLQGQKVKKDW
ncbi:MAG: hypothetical protein DWQ01_20320 [Planctomycetota bacterium]|nr:MAG: hypothetical protein DWQ01_20320 [Planctomycetota bacterium]